MVLSCALLGAGYFGKHYVRLLGEVSGAHLSAVFDPALSSDAFQEIQKVHPGVRCAQTFEEILKAPEIGAVIIATPASTHTSFITLALKAGKHILVEKPMTANLSDALSLERIVQESGKTLMVGHQYLYNDYIRRLKEIVDGKALGKIHSFCASHFYLGPIRRDIGCFWETATHELAILDYLFGPLMIEGVTGKAVYMRERSGIEDAATASFHSSNGLAASISVSWFSPEKVRNFFICGEKGIVLFDDIEKKEKLRLYRYPYPDKDAFKVKSSFFFEPVPQQVEVCQVDSREPLLNQLEHFIHCVQEGVSPLTDLAHGVRVTRQLAQIVDVFQG